MQWMNRLTGRGLVVCCLLLTSCENPLAPGIVGKWQSDAMSANTIEFSGRNAAGDCDSEDQQRQVRFAGKGPHEDGD